MDDRRILLLRNKSIAGGLLVGAIVGLAQDSLSKNPLGMFGITKTIIGYFAASVGLRPDVDHPMIRLRLGFFFFFFHQFILWVLLRVLIAAHVRQHQEILRVDYDDLDEALPHHTREVHDQRALGKGIVEKIRDVVALGEGDLRVRE